MKKIPPTRRFRPRQVQGKQLNYNARTLGDYKRTLKAMVYQMRATLEKELFPLLSTEESKKFFKDRQAFASDSKTSSDILTVSQLLADRFNAGFTEAALGVASKMVGQQISASATAVNRTLKQMGAEVTLTSGIVPERVADVGAQAIQTNIDLIKSIPVEYMQRVNKTLVDAISSGGDISTIKDTLYESGAITERRAKNIADDQVRKSYNAVNAVTLKSVGVKKFRWLHSGGGQHPRQSHIAMSGEVFSFDDLPVINQENVDRGYEGPEQGIPGQAYNCRCTMGPVFDFEEDDNANNKP